MIFEEELYNPGFLSTASAMELKIENQSVDPALNIGAVYSTRGGMHLRKVKNQKSSNWDFYTIGFDPEYTLSSVNK